MKNIALVAHDSRKKELLDWLTYNKTKLAKFNLYATGTTGGLIEKSGLKVTRLLSGPLGGDAQIGAMIAEGKVDCLIFFCDNLIIQGHNSDVQGLSRLASLYNIAYASNRTTADLLISSPLFDDEEYKINVPSCIAEYRNRKI